MERVDYQTLLVQDLMNLHRASELDLHPWYQRRSVWTKAQKSYLINTIFEQKPVPSLYIRHSLDLEKEKSVKEVIDGQQRITAILEYADNQFAARHPKHERPVLCSQLSKTEKQAFRMTGLSIGVLVAADDSDVIEIFGRLNSVAKTLNLQEKRNARFGGDFKQFCLKQASDRVRFWRDYNIFSANEIARMTEVQFVSELAINMLFGLSDYSTNQIDDFYQKHEESFPKRSEVETRMEKVFAKLASIKMDAIRDTIFSRSPLLFTLFLVLDSTGMGDGHEFMRFSELGGGPPLIDGRARRTGSPDPHDPEKALRRSRATADNRGAVSRGFRGAQHGTWQLLNTSVKEEKNFIFS